MRRCALPIAVLLAARAAPGAAQELPPSALSVEQAGEWHRFWSSAEAPARWRGPDPRVALATRWSAVRRGLDRAELRVAVDGTPWRLRLVAVRLEPRHFRMALVAATRDGGARGGWSIDEADPVAALAVNAGQFREGAPWGWLVRDGEEIQAPGPGPLSSALVVGGDGTAHVVPAAGIPAARAAGGVHIAFQSYPTLLTGEGRVPPQLAAPGRGVDLRHRDARLAACELWDGRLLLLITRFDALGPAGERLPLGPTTPETAALLGALGCREAVMLDGGLSAQLLVRDADGREQRWRGSRQVPLALIAAPILP